MIDQDQRRQSAPAPSRIGAIPTYDIPPHPAHRTRASIRSIARGRSRSSIRGRRNRNMSVPAIHPHRTRPTEMRKSPHLCRRLSRARCLGQPPRRRLKVDDDPFANVGFHTGSFLSKAAVEVWGGYNTNPGRIDTPKGSAFYTVSPRIADRVGLGAAFVDRRPARLLHRLWHHVPAAR